MKLLLGNFELGAFSPMNEMVDGSIVIVNILKIKLGVRMRRYTESDFQHEK